MAEVPSSLTSELTSLAQETEQGDVDFENLLVGEGKKYTSTKELAKAYYHADVRIRELTEDDKSNKENTKLLDEVLSEIRKSSTPPTPEPKAPDTSSASPSPGLKPEQIAEIVDNRLTQLSQAEARKANTQKSIKLLTEAYGAPAKAVQAIESITKGNPAMAQALEVLSATNPEKLLELVKNAAPLTDITPNVPPIGGANKSANAIVPATANGLTWAMCQKLRKENEKEYNSKEFRDKMAAAVAMAQSKGRDFFAT